MQSSEGTEEESSATEDQAPTIIKSSEGLSDVGILNDAKLNQEVSSFFKSHLTSQFFSKLLTISISLLGHQTQTCG